MKVYCMHCGHPIDLGQGYDNFQGPLRCAVCKTLMTVRITVGELRAMELGSRALTPGLSHPAPISGSTERKAATRPVGGPPQGS